MMRHTCTPRAFRQLVDVWILAIERDGIESLISELRRVLANGGRLASFNVSVRVLP